jgi:predicted O-linked N-acetylglucosamine transferase (SPINDLY family)
VRLPDTYQPTDSLREIPVNTPTRAEANLPDDGFVFCCFNDHHKILPEVFDVWMRVLSRVPGSVLWLLQISDASARGLRVEAMMRGVAPERLVFAPLRPMPEHLARHRLADLFLDTLPYNAHTTASDALWAGLPLLTCIGSAFAGRVAASLLRAAGLPELVTYNRDDYETMAVRLASSPELLARLRAKLAGNRSTCALFDVRRYTRHIESAYITMHERAVRGEPLAGFDVAPLPAG